MSAQTNEEAIAEIWRLFKETDAEIKETNKSLAKQSQETDAKLRRLEGLFGDQWGKLIEALVHPNALKLFRDRGIDVRAIYRRAELEREGQRLEIDLLLENSRQTVLVEVKSTVRIGDIDDLLADLERFPRFSPRHAGRHTYGAVAGLSFAEGADRYAYRKGLFVLGIVGEGLVRIRNDANFRPKDFGRRQQGRDSMS
jgi:hypothetical protein